MSSATKPVEQKARELEDRIARAMYDDWPIRAVSPRLAEMAGVELMEPITWERSIEIGADHSGLRRLARAAIAALNTDGERIRREAFEEAAKVAEGYIRDGSSDETNGAAWGAANLIAKRIRGLISTPSKVSIHAEGDRP